MPASPSLLIVPARFKTGKLYTQIATTPGGLVLGASGDFNVTRDTTATRVNANGLIEGVASGIPRLDYPLGGGCPALLVEPAATNLVLQSRSLNNAVWSGTTVTTVKDAVGANGTASGATTITATAASGTVLQALAHESQSRVFSAYIRRVSGSGDIQLTTNGGTNWDTVTITSGYTLVASEARTVASGTVGIRLAASGDVIEVDYAQGEVGPVATSRIPTTIGSVTRNADVISLSGAVSGCIGQTEGTIYVEAFIPKISSAFVVGISNGLQLTQSVYLQVQTNLNLNVLIRSGGTAVGPSIADANWSAGLNKVAFTYGSGSCSVVLNGGSPVTGTVTNVPTCNIITLGSRVDIPGTLSLTDRIRAVALYTTRLTNAELQSLTTL